MTATRLHGKASLDPAEYAFVRAIDTEAASALAGADPLFGLVSFAEWAQMVAAAREEAAQLRALVSPHRLQQCTHCGAHLRYAVIWKHLPTGEHIVTGEQCAEERMALESRAMLELSLAKKAAEAHAAQVKMTAAAHKWIAAHEALWGDLLANRGDRFIGDMVTAVGKYGGLTEKQEAAVPAVLAKLAEWTTPGATCELRIVVEAPEGKAMTIEGEVVKAEWREDTYSGRTRAVMTVKTEAGWLAWGTVPADLLSEMGMDGDDLRGKRVRFTADLERAGGKTGGMAFTKRPRKATILG